MRTLSDLLIEIPRYQSGGDIEVVRRAYEFTQEVHRGQLRVSGEPYDIHPLAVAGLLVEFKMDATTVAAGLLHDVLEDTATSKAVLVERFGGDIAELVDGVTKIGKLAFASREERQAENFRKMLVAMARDIRVLMIKLADRLHNMRTLHYLPPEKQRAIGQETLDIYAPLAHRLGMAKVKGELEDLALKALHPEAYDDLQRRVAKRRLEREAEINQVITIITTKLPEVGISGQITGRPKHFYSIYKKMQAGREFDEIYDLTAVRILAPTVRECYGALGMVHSLWKPVPGRFKDFIAIPKSNMYQSLHTTVIGPKGDPVEIQIRTPDMHRIAEEGIAAHWLYKEKKDRTGLDQAFVWLRQLLEWQKEMKDPREFMETVKVDLFPDEVYVFTPKGDVKALPEGSTPIDFAYAVHTRGRQPLRRRPRQREARAPSPRAPPGRHRRGRHVAHAEAVARLAQDRQVDARPVQGQAVASDRGAGPLAHRRPRAPRPRGAEAPPLARPRSSSRRSSGSSPSSTGTPRWMTCSPGSATASLRPRPWSRGSSRPRRRTNPGRRRSPRSPRARGRRPAGSRSRAWTTCSSGSRSAAAPCRATRSWASSPGDAASPCTRRIARTSPEAPSTASGR